MKKVLMKQVLTHLIQVRGKNLKKKLKSVKQGLKAGDLVKKVAAVTGGGGGGRPHLATAGGKDQGKLREAIALLRNILEDINH